MESTLRLFKAVPIKEKKTKKSKYWLGKTIEFGFVFSLEVIANYNENELERIFNQITSIYGMSAEQMNNSFHKSWKKVKEASIEQLFIEQIMHYFTTYGFEALGIDSDYIYIPDEELNIPEVKDVKLIVIRGYAREELKEKLLSLLNSGIALKDTTIKDVVDVSLFVEIAEEDLSRIKNKEVRIILYEYLDILPKNPVEFLRYAIYKATEKTLIIKSAELIGEIKEKQNINTVGLFNKYKNRYGLENLAEIFFRFKPLFLAFRTNAQLKIIINRIRRLANQYHEPMSEDFLNSITYYIKSGTEIDDKKLFDELERVNIFRKIRLAYALKYRTKDVDSILYRVRNGKGYATDFNFNGDVKPILDIVINSIIKDISKNVSGKKIYIPNYIAYTLPATEKQFTGQIPSGSFVTIDRDMVFGINWHNVKRNRIDLDLSVISKEGKIGWDSAYRNDERTILFSGDMTDAQNGATELFYVKKQLKSSMIMFVNYFNYDKEIEVPYKILVAKEKAEDFRQNYTVNPNNILAISNSIIDKKQMILGLSIITTEECRFYFVETSLGRNITSSNNEFVNHARNYLFNFYENTISLNDILLKSGAKIVNKIDKNTIDLSLENLEKDTILNLIKQRR